MVFNVTMLHVSSPFSTKLGLNFLFKFGCTLAHECNNLCNNHGWKIEEYNAFNSWIYVKGNSSGKLKYYVEYKDIHWTASIHYK